MALSRAVPTGTAVDDGDMARSRGSFCCCGCFVAVAGAAFAKAGEPEEAVPAGVTDGCLKDGVRPLGAPDAGGLGPRLESGYLICPARNELTRCSIQMEIEITHGRLGHGSW